MTSHSERGSRTISTYEDLCGCEPPHPQHTIYNILTKCYGLKGRRRYLKTDELDRDKQSDAVDKHYVSAHVKPLTNDYFHFVSTPHYQEGAALFTREHRGRIMLMMRHPCEIAESIYLSRPGTIPGDVNGLLNYTTSSDYYDNWMCSYSSLATWTDPRLV
ncbi:hypothetical protein ACHAXN_007419 [Cyclotella atomus]